MFGRASIAYAAIQSKKAILVCAERSTLDSMPTFSEPRGSHETNGLVFLSPDDDLIAHVSWRYALSTGPEDRPWTGS